MRVDFNGIMREMTSEEIKELEYPTTFFPENNETDGDISERVSKLEKQIENTNTEIVSLKEILNVIKEILMALDKTTTDQ